MKILQEIVLSIGLIRLLYSRQSTDQVLSKSDKGMEIINTIATDESMSEEMMGIFMKSNMAKMMMQEKDGKMMKDKHAEIKLRNNEKNDKMNER